MTPDAERSDEWPHGHNWHDSQECQVDVIGRPKYSKVDVCCSSIPWGEGEDTLWEAGSLESNSRSQVDGA